MSTKIGEIKVNAPYQILLRLTQFCGGDKRGRCLFLSGEPVLNGDRFSVEFTESDARKLGEMIQKFLNKEV